MTHDCNGKPAGLEITVDLEELITAWGMFSEAAVAVSARLGQGLDDTGNLSLSEFDVMIRLHREPAGRLPMTRLAAEVGLSTGGFTKLADRMENAGLVTRERSNDDRRVIFVAPTEYGRSSTVAALAHHADHLRRAVLDPLGIEQVRVLTELARSLRDANRGTV